MENPTLIGALQRLLPRSGALPEAVVHELRQAQLDSIMSRATAATVTSTAFAAVLAVYLAPAVGAGFAGLWLALKVAAALPRFFLSLFAFTVLYAVLLMARLRLEDARRRVRQ